LLDIVKKHFGDWYKDIDKEKYYLVLTNDIDSYLSCLYLKKKFGVQIGGFYDFKALYINSEISKGKDPIYVDGDTVNGYAFGNHVTGIRNKDCVNLNCKINTSNYNMKYAGSTLLTLYSLYNEDLRKHPKYQIQLLLTIDVWFKQYFCYRDKWDFWVKMMGMEYLTDIISEYDIDDYYSSLIEMGLNAKIEILPDGSIDFPINYDGIKNNFNLSIPKPDCSFDMKILDLHTWNGFLQGMLTRDEKIFSNAMTYKNKMSYSYI